MTKSQDFVILLAHEIDSNIATLREILNIFSLNAGIEVLITNRDVKI